MLSSFIISVMKNLDLNSDVNTSESVVTIYDKNS